MLQDVEEYVLDYSRTVIQLWTPAESCVMDICLTEHDLRVIDLNNINSSGFTRAILRNMSMRFKLSMLDRAISASVSLENATPC